MRHAVAALLDGYAVEDRIGFLLRRANQLHTAILHDGMVASELTPTQFAALTKVVELGQVTQNHLGRLTAMDPATIQGVVRRLLDRDLVTRAADPLDKRAIVLAPTRSGLALLAEAVAAARHVTEATLAPDERAVSLSLLRRLC